MGLYFGHDSHIRSGVQFAICDIMLMLKSFGFWNILDLKFSGDSQTVVIGGKFYGEHQLFVRIINLKTKGDTTFAVYVVS